MSMLNPKAAVCVDPDKPELAAVRVMELDANEEAYQAMLSEPLFSSPDSFDRKLLKQRVATEFTQRFRSLKNLS